MTNLLSLIENEQLINKHYELHVGNIVEVKLWIIEGEKKRLQSFEGIIIAKKNKGLNSSFTIRRIINNEGIERVFSLHSPLINNIIIKRKIKVKKAKLYYFRKLSSKLNKYKHMFSGKK